MMRARIPGRGQRSLPMANLKSGQYDRGLADLIDASLYDTFILKNALGATKIRMFQVAQGGQGPSGETKTLDLCNLKLGGQVPANQKWRIHAVKLVYVGHAQLATIQKIYDFLNKSVLELVVDGKDVMYQKPLSSTMGIALGVELMPAATFSLAELPRSNVHGIDPLNKPIDLPANCIYEWDLTMMAASDASLDADRLRVELVTEFLRANA